MDRKKILWGFISLVIAGFSIWAVTAQSSSFTFKEFSDFVHDADPRWAVAAVLCSLGFIIFEGMAVRCIAGALGYKRSVGQGTVYGAADVYFSAITPSASGGQPASAYFMVKDGIPGTVVTVTLLVNLIMYTIALLFLGIVSCAFRIDIVLRMSVLSKVLISVGTLVLVGLVIAFYLLLRKAEVFYKICNGGLNFLEKIHLLRHGEKLRNKLNATMAEYKECAQSISGKKQMLVKAFVWNLLQRLSQMMVAFFVFMGSGMGFGKSIEVLVTQCFVSLGSNCVPVPGAMGVADYIMLDGYNNILGEEIATYMELLVRGVSFYECIIVSAIIVVVAFIVGKVKGKRC
ncbi:MAG: flippase-like domain-containing protein [Saccharofermentans sp.]|nr:flippase-like domain-containing protein [Saccharofermentans sp.]